MSFDRERSAIQSIFNSYLETPRYRTTGNKIDRRTPLLKLARSACMTAGGMGLRSLNSPNRQLYTTEQSQGQGQVQGQGQGISLKGIAQFAKDFDLCPVVIELSLLYKIFGEVLAERLCPPNTPSSSSSCPSPSPLSLQRIWAVDVDVDVDVDRIENRNKNKNRSNDSGNGNGSGSGKGLTSFTPEGSRECQCEGACECECECDGSLADTVGTSEVDDNCSVHSSRSPIPSMSRANCTLTATATATAGININVTSEGEPLLTLPQVRTH